MGRMKVITIYELLGLIKDGEAPKKIKFQKNENINYYEFNKELNDYEDINTGDLFFIDRYDANKILNNIITILEDEEEFEDIEEIDVLIKIMSSDKIEGLTHEISSLDKLVNQLIRNQKKIIERLNEK